MGGAKHNAHFTRQFACCSQASMRSDWALNQAKIWHIFMSFTMPIFVCVTSGGRDRTVLVWNMSDYTRKATLAVNEVAWDFQLDEFFNFVFSVHFSVNNNGKD
jgi:hypothetical protein